VGELFLFENTDFTQSGPLKSSLQILYIPVDHWVVCLGIDGLFGGHDLL
jgi:hypothetical protein